MTVLITTMWYPLQTYTMSTSNRYPQLLNGNAGYALFSGNLRIHRKFNQNRLINEFATKDFLKYCSQKINVFFVRCRKPYNLKNKIFSTIFMMYF